MNQLSLRARIFLRILESAQFGTLTITFPDGKTQDFGNGDPRFAIRVIDWRVFDAIFTRGGLGFAEALMDGKIMVDDTTGLIEWACRNDEALELALRGKWYGAILDTARRLWLERNSISGSRRNIAAHYDLGNEFYGIWLDHSLTYSSGIFRTPQDDLQLAQLRKYDRIIDQLNITADDHVLEIGCGWGGFFTRAAERTGCRITAITISAAQAQHARALIQERGLGDRVELREIDYRKIVGQFDKVVSIEMIEAVGEEYWPTYFKKVADSLNTRGRALIQGITIRDDLFERYRGSTDFIQKYIFPGGMLLPRAAFREQGERYALALRDRFEFAESYAHTLSRWRENFESRVHDVKALGFDERFVRLWRLYLSYCEGGFRSGRISVGQYLFEKM